MAKGGNTGGASSNQGASNTTASSVNLAESSVGDVSRYSKPGGCNPCACWALKDACIVVGIWTVIYGILNLALFGWQTSIVELEKEFAASQRALWYGTLSRQDPRYPASYEQYYQTPEERFLLGLYIVQIVHLISDIFLIGAGLAIIFAAHKESRFLLWPYFPAVFISIACSAGFVAVWLLIPKKPSTAASLSSLKSVRERIPYWPVMVAFQFLMFLINIYCVVVVIAGYRHISSGSLKDVGYVLDWKPKKRKYSSKSHKRSTSAAADNKNSGASGSPQKYGAQVNESFMTSPSTNYFFDDANKGLQMGNMAPSFNLTSSPTRIRHPLDFNLMQQQSASHIPPDPFQSNNSNNNELFNKDIPPPYHAPYVSGEKSTFTNHWLDTIEQPVPQQQQQQYIPTQLPLVAPNLADFIPPPPTHSIDQSSYQRRQKHRRSKRRPSSRLRRRRPPDSNYFDDDNYDYDSEDGDRENDYRTAYDSRSGITSTSYDNQTYLSRSNGRRRSSGRNRRRPENRSTKDRRHGGNRDHSTSSTDASSIYSTSDNSISRTEEGKSYRSRSTREVRNSSAGRSRGVPKSRSAYFPSSDEDEAKAVRRDDHSEDANSTVISSSNASGRFKRSRSDGRLSDHRRSTRCSKPGCRRTDQRQRDPQSATDHQEQVIDSSAQTGQFPQSAAPKIQTQSDLPPQPPASNSMTNHPADLLTNKTGYNLLQPSAGHEHPATRSQSGNLNPRLQPASTQQYNSIAQPSQSNNQPPNDFTTITIPHHIVIPFPTVVGSPQVSKSATSTNLDQGPAKTMPSTKFTSSTTNTGTTANTTNTLSQPGNSQNPTNKYQIKSEITIRVPPSVAPKNSNVQFNQSQTQPITPGLTNQRQAPAASNGTRNVQEASNQINLSTAIDSSHRSTSNQRQSPVITTTTKVTDTPPGSGAQLDTSIKSPQPGSTYV